MIRYAVSLCLLLAACSDAVPTTPETRPVEEPNAGNTAIYDVDPDDPYELGDGSFLDMVPGDSLARFGRLLFAGTYNDGGNGSFPVHYISGRRNDTLGYVFSADDATIESIIILSTDVVTQDGIRVGNSYDALRERLGPVAVTGIETEARVYASKPPFIYRLAMNAGPGPVETTQIDPATKILTIEIH